MSWIETIEFDDAQGPLKELYQRVSGPDNNVDNIMLVHSLRPKTLEGHMSLYKAVLHNPSNSFPKWFLECIGVYVSHMNRCLYCVDHHYTGLRRLLKNDERAAEIKKALEKNVPERVFDGKELAALRYVHHLTIRPYDVRHVLMNEMRDAGLSDGEILEVNQVAAYFSYANRTVLGLGVTTEGDVLGLSPSEDGSWNHS